jgi:hypothetical protein
MVLGAWLIFTETYTNILDAALLGPSSSMNIEWVDDAFFGYICTAKACVCVLCLFVCGHAKNSFLTQFLLCVCRTCWGRPHPSSPRLWVQA